MAGVGGLDDVGGPEVAMLCRKIFRVVFEDSRFSLSFFAVALNSHTAIMPQWFNSLPIITKYWFAGTAALTVGGNLGIISFAKIPFVWEAVKDKFEIWRFLTPFCFAGKFSIGMLFTIYMLVQFSKQYEAASPYNTGGGGGTADYAFCMVFGMALILLTYPVISIYLPLGPIFTRNMIFYVCYVWSKRNPTAPANIWGIPFKGIYMPFAYLGLSVLMGNPYFDIIHGIVVGHIYYFLVDVVPLVYGKDVLHTPQFFIDFFGIGEYVPPAPAAPARAGGQPLGGHGNNTWNGPGRVNAPNDPARGNRGGHQWGSGGRALGAD